MKKMGINPKLAVIMVGDNPASKVYVRNKSRACDEGGTADYIRPLVRDLLFFRKEEWKWKEDLKK